MDDYSEETKLYFTRSMLLKYLDPFNERPFLSSKKNSELIEMMFHFSTNFMQYKFTDYEYTCKKEPENEEIRSPIPAKRERLIADESFFEDVRYRSEQDEAERYNKELRIKQEEDRIFEEAVKKSIEEEEMRRILQMEEEKIVPEIKEGPNYDKLREIHSDFTPELCDKLYNLLKQEKYNEYHEELKNVPLTVVSVLNRLTSKDGTSLKQALFKKKDPYKCLE